LYSVKSYSDSSSSGRTATLILIVSFQDHLAKLVPQCQTILDFVAATDDGDGTDDNQPPVS